MERARQQAQGRLGQEGKEQMTLVTWKHRAIAWTASVLSGIGAGMLVPADGNWWRYLAVATLFAFSIHSVQPATQKWWLP